MRNRCRGLTEQPARPTHLTPKFSSLRIPQSLILQNFALCDTSMQHAGTFDPPSAVMRTIGAYFVEETTTLARRARDSVDQLSWTKSAIIQPGPHGR